MSNYNRNWDAESIPQSMHEKDAPNIFLTFKKQVATKDAKEKDMEKLCLKELNQPTGLKNVNVLKGKEQGWNNYSN